jgi:prepilin-type N-terminal cleavage/methylation domain-containing protein
MPFYSKSTGFTLPELLISMAIIMLIFAFGSINLLRIVPKAHLDEAFTTFIADAKSQQNAAMLGQSTSGTQVSQSIKFNTNSYTLFKGQIYSPTDPSNFTVNCPQNVTITTNFAGSVMTFLPMTGELNNYNSNASQVTFTGVGGQSVIIKLNMLGNVYYVNKI